MYRGSCTQWANALTVGVFVVQARPTAKELRQAKATIEALEQQLVSSHRASERVSSDLGSRMSSALREVDDNRRFASTKSLVQRDKALHRMQVSTWLGLCPCGTIGGK